MNIVQFLEARLAEDERAAITELNAGSQSARAVREVSFKRGLVDRVYRESNWDLRPGADEENHGGKPLLVQLAAIYADHPDFDPRWAD